jgi:hypothetical protein
MYPDLKPSEAYPTADLCVRFNQNAPHPSLKRYSITVEDGSFVFGGIKHATLPNVIEAMKVTPFKSQNTLEMNLRAAAR